MRKVLLAGLLGCSPFALAQDDAAKQDRATKPIVQPESASTGASGDAARARAGANASVEGGAALGATGVNSRPAARAEEAEKEKRRLGRAQRTEKKNEEK